jgi:DMSO/TMAO reductase YedYZ molybdopterin-dependent catalytic subunit
MGGGSMLNGNNLIISPHTERKDRVPPGQRVTDKWPVLHNGPVHKVDSSKWTFTISGLVEKQRSLTFNEFIALDHVQIKADIHCVTGWSRLNNNWEGISSQAIAKLVKILPEAFFVIVRCEGGFTTNLHIDDFAQIDVLFAVKHDGIILSPEHGYPTRLVVPSLYFWKSAKWVTGIEFSNKDKPGFWESHGYHNHGDPWKEERYS